MMWGISAGLLVLGYFNAVLVTALRRSTSTKPAISPEPVDMLPLEVGSEVPGSGFSRIADVLADLERARSEEGKTRPSRGRSNTA